MAAAEHGADFPAAEKIRQSMSHQQMHDFAVGSMADKPEHVSKPTLKGDNPSVVDQNVRDLRSGGMNERQATVAAIAKSQADKPKQPRHKNLGAFLHPRKDGKPHGSD